MTIKLHCLGCELDERIPGKMTYLYWVESSNGMMDTIRDEDYLEDGEYEVADTFFEEHCEEQLEEAVW